MRTSWTAPTASGRPPNAAAMRLRSIRIRCGSGCSVASAASLFSIASETCCSGARRCPSSSIGGDPESATWIAPGSAAISLASQYWSLSVNRIDEPSFAAVR